MKTPRKPIESNDNKPVSVTNFLEGSHWNRRFRLLFAFAIISITGACDNSSSQEATKKEAAGKETTKKVAQGISKNVAQSSNGKLILRRKSIHDAAKRNMTSHTIFVPEGWSMEGSPAWPNRAFFKMLPSPKIVVSSPNGMTATINRTGVFSDPRPSAEYRNYYGISRPREKSSDGGSLVLYRPDTLRDWKKYFRDTVIPERHPNATKIEVKKVSEVEQFSNSLIKNAKPLISQVQQTNQLARSYGLPENQSISIHGLMIEAVFEEGGVRKEFIALAGVHSIETQMQGMTQVRWSVEPNLSYVAPKGKLERNLPTLFAITGSMRPTQKWIREVQRYVARNTPTGRTPSSSNVNVANTFSEILDISHNGFRSRMNSGDTSQRKYVNSIHETSDYSYGGTNYHLPAGYDHVYTDEFDTIILTNDSLFDPNVELKTSNNWKKMTER